VKRKKILERSGEIRKFILAEIGRNPRGITAAVVRRFGISRQAAARYLAQMVKEGRLAAKGATRDRAYVLGRSVQKTKSFRLSAGLDESRIWEEDFKPLCADLPPNVLSICAYAFTEMVNNVLDHSGGKNLTVTLSRTPGKILLDVEDDGIGIFRKIKKAKGLTDERQAILELSKGKLTTDPVRHTGEGIFFTSRAVDYFAVNSSGLVFFHQAPRKQGRLEAVKNGAHPGTVVHMSIRPGSKRKLKEVFDKFADPKNDYAFDKTIVPVRLAQYEGEELLSRSQAKRLMLRVENFKTVQLDFEGVQSVGPAFADEIFRVYRNSHPGIRLIPLHASREVLKMIRRAQAAGSP
jgi:anti-sigma regulatory factor (Ser/Thr protein kinase)